MAYHPAGAYPPPVLPQPVSEPPRELALVRGMLNTTLVVCLCGDVVAIASLARETSAIAIVAVLVTTYFATQSLVSPAPLMRGARWAWFFTFASALVGLLSGIPVIATGLAWLGSQPYVLPVGLVWTILYAVLTASLMAPPVRRWIFG